MIRSVQHHVVRISQICFIGFLLLGTIPFYGQISDSLRATQLFLVADSLNEHAQFEEALLQFQRCLEIRSKELGGSHPLVADAYNGIGRTQINLGNYEVALAFLLKALEICESKVDARLADTYNNIGVTYHYKADYQQALTYYEKSMDTRKQVFGRLHKKVAESCGNIGLVYSVLGDYEKALYFYREGLSILEEILEPGHLNFTYLYNKLGIIYRIKGDYATAEEYYERSSEVLRNKSIVPFIIVGLGLVALVVMFVIILSRPKNIADLEYLQSLEARKIGRAHV